jgi:hypothetical protein
MRKAARAVLAAGGVLLLCGQALSQERVRLPRKGSSPGFEFRVDGERRVPRQGNEAGPSWEERERWARLERAERREREKRLEWLEGEERRERQARVERLARLERLEQLERERERGGRQRHCRRLADRARQDQEQAKQKVVIGYLAGGLVGAFITSSQNDDALKEPKVVWDETYNNCMGRGQQGQDDDDDDDNSSRRRND